MKRQLVYTENSFQYGSKKQKIDHINEEVVSMSSHKIEKLIKDESEMVMIEKYPKISNHYWRKLLLLLYIIPQNTDIVYTILKIMYILNNNVLDIILKIKYNFLNINTTIKAVDGHFSMIHVIDNIINTIKLSRSHTKKLIKIGYISCITTKTDDNYLEHDNTYIALPMIYSNNNNNNNKEENIINNYNQRLKQNTIFIEKASRPIRDIPFLNSMQNEINLFIIC